jgi:all-trans-retinol 13,14-reductase
MERREFLKSLMAAPALGSFDWDAFPDGARAQTREGEFDAIIIGSGLGGLSCGYAFARKNFRALVLEQHDRPGGYATSFSRPGGFVFDVSLHSTVVGKREDLYNLIPGLPEITDVEFVPHPHLYRAIVPEHELVVPQKDLPGYIKLLAGHFPEEEAGIRGIIEDMEGLARDIGRFSGAGSMPDMSRFSTEFPYLFKYQGKTWGQMADARIKNPQLKAIVSNLWGYYGLPPSRLSCYYYALPTIGYLAQGGYYPRGTSQKISSALAKYIEDKGGKVVLRTSVEEIVVKDRTATGVRTADGKQYAARVIVSNAGAHGTFRSMMNEGDYLKEYLARLDSYSVSLSAFQVFLGLKTDLVGKLGLTDSEVFYHGGYDLEAEYQLAVNADVERGWYGLMLYDNLYRGYSPKGKNTINIIALQGYDHWKPYEADYYKGNKSVYRAEKQRMAKVLISKVEETLLPGLSNSIQIMEAGSPLTHARYTRNYRGAVYGWDQTLNNSGPNRLPHKTPIRTLYLAGAWTTPGHGYGGVIFSGLQCFAEIMKTW